jgi:hypothetical protein
MNNMLSPCQAWTSSPFAKATADRMERVKGIEPFEARMFATTLCQYPKMFLVVPRIVGFQQIDRIITLRKLAYEN